MDLRSKRVRKFRAKNRPLEIMIKLVLICYIAIFSVSYLTAGTSAYFSSSEELNPVIAAGDWGNDQWDESSLVFTTKGNQNIKTCPAEIELNLKNVGEGDMQDDSTYEIYYVKNGNPEKHGEKIELGENEEERIIEVLKSGEETKLTYETNVSGIYVFVVYQQENHPDEERTWSKWIKVDCPKEKSSTSQENKQKRNQPDDTEDQKEEASVSEEDIESKSKPEKDPNSAENTREEENKQSSVEEDEEFEDS